MTYLLLKTSESTPVKSGSLNSLFMGRKQLCMTAYQHGFMNRYNDGKSKEFCHYSDESSCINLPEDWKNIMSAVQSDHTVVLFSLPNCSGKVMQLEHGSECSRYFRTSDCPRHDMNDNSESIAIFGL